MGVLSTTHRRSPATSSVELEIPSGRRFSPVGRLVAGGFAARSGLTVDRIADLQRALDLVLELPRYSGSIELVMTEAPEGVRVEAGPLARNAALRHELESVVSGLVDDVSVYDFGVYVRLALHLDISPRDAS